MPELRFDFIDRKYAEILAAKTPGERAWMINDCHKTARIFMEAGERSRHPDWTDEQIRAAVSKRLLDGTD